MSSMDDHSLEKRMRSELYNLRDTPDPGTWEKLSQQLDQPERPRRTFLMWSLAAAGILIVGVLTIGNIRSSEEGRERNVASAVPMADSAGTKAAQNGTADLAGGGFRGREEASSAGVRENKEDDGARTVPKDDQKVSSYPTKEPVSERRDELSLKTGLDRGAAEEPQENGFTRENDQPGSPVEVLPADTAEVLEGGLAQLSDDEPAGKPGAEIEKTAPSENTAEVETVPSAKKEVDDDKESSIMKSTTPDAATQEGSVSARTTGAADESSSAQTRDDNQLDIPVVIDSTAVNAAVNEAIDSVGLSDPGELPAEKEKRFRSVAVTLMTGPSFTFNSFRGYESDAHFVNALDDPSAFSKDRLGYRTSVLVEWSFLRKWKISGGGSYQGRAYAGDFESVQYVAGDMEYIGEGDLVLITPVESRSQLRYREKQREIALTINAAYKLPARVRGAHYIGIGLNSGWYTAKATVNDRKGSIRSHQTSFNVFYDLEHSLTEKWYFHIQPLFTRRFGKSDGYTIPVTRTGTYDVSLLFGMGFRFR